MRIRLSLFAFWIFIWPVLYIAFAILFTLGMKRGPSSEDIRTVGIFEPGGKIRVELRKKIHSVEGHHQGTARLEIPDKSTWPRDYYWREEVTFGEPWEETISAETITHDPIRCIIPMFSIPRNLELPGNTTTFHVNIRIKYPEMTTAPPDRFGRPRIEERFFKNRSILISEDMDIQIAGNTGSPLSVWERLAYTYTYYDAPTSLFIFVWVIGFFVLVYHYRKQKGLIG
ncbi:MAG: hypothetical protein ACE5G0_12075 [Rhodothermales bacterium]